jgi:hypothetical protein
MSAYTPLEALLLFQYVSNYGLSSGAVFNKVSTILKKDNQIINSTSYDSGRLSPDALRDFFLKALKEAKSDVQEPQGPNGNVQPNSRKRKAPSPTLPTLEEAVNDAYLIPPLIRKLYARYREHAIIEIRESERKYTKLRKELDDIESGAWNERLQQELDRGEWDHVIRGEQAGHVEMGETETERAKMPAALVSAPEQPKSLVDEQVQRLSSQLSRPPEEKEEPATVRPPGRPAESLQGKAQEPRKVQSSSERPSVLANIPLSTQTHPSHPPLIPPRISPRPPATQAALVNAQHALRPPPLAPSPSPRPQEIQQAQNRTISSPAMLPPPLPGVSQPIPPYPFPMNPQLPSRQLAQNPYAAGAVPQPQMMPGSQPHAGPQMPNANAQSNPGPLHGGKQLEPWNVDPQTPMTTRPQPSVGHAVAQTLARPALSALGQPPLTDNTPAPSVQLPLSFSPFDIARMLSTPLPNVRTQLAASTPSKAENATRWTPSKKPAKATKPRKSSPRPPSPRSVSPLSESAVSPAPEASISKPTRAGRQPATSLAPDPLVRASRSQARRGRGGSVASSAIGSSIRGRTRSQSVTSHAEDVSMADNDSVTGQTVKNEPSTPADAMDYIRPTIEGTPHNSFGAVGTRRAALQSNANKRKRGAREDSEASDMTVQPRIDRSVVVAVRNFHKTSATVMNDILSHKHASLFSAPVKDKHAAGYTGIVRRPQDLKSIKAAIVAGNRAVTSISAADPSTALSGSPRDAGGSVILPMSEDLIPPKGIVNSAQLEKEVMRVFVNAVMFNPGDSEMVQDAREMFEGAERVIGDFRSVERSSGLVLPQPVRETSSKQRESTGRASESVADVEGDLEDTPAAAIAKRRR